MKQCKKVKEEKADSDGSEGGMPTGSGPGSMPQGGGPSLPVGKPQHLNLDLILSAMAVTAHQCLALFE